MANYIKTFKEELDARSWMEMKNKAARRAKNYNDTFCFVDGPDDNFCVVDLKTAIELEIAYAWSE